MFILKALIKILDFLLTRPLLLFLIFSIALIVSWYVQGGVIAAIFIGIILFFILLFILVIFGIQASKTSEDNKSETYIEYDEKGVKNIRSEIPTHIVSRRNGKQTEHVILSKHTHLPQKITYE